ncbi:hypothetical protein JCM31826_13660 [Thermaurantimonas aggregans]|uniref:XapX domain-containing protein n=1 Tax=Thermaurantimonas aggregans TaxID=2173829 RepID=A0A401XLL6_9FLAO|nr:hypothetical protein [Thermaurantimonas aggregans]MCX8149141.1 hypothetical protein [Thermaurantimonas aggregans]GCD77884.1 hypothetical protein JCM31826_13660 [Thermaurantimonas aggregans]
MKKLAFALIALMPVFLMAQPGMPNNPTPIDGLIGLLAAAGVTFGISEYSRRRRNRD